MNKTVLLSLLVGCMSFGAVQAMDDENVQNVRRGFRDPSTYRCTSDFTNDVFRVFEDHQNQNDLYEETTIESDEELLERLRAHLAACSNEGCVLYMGLSCIDSRNGTRCSLESYLQDCIQDAKRKRDGLIQDPYSQQFEEFYTK